MKKELSDKQWKMHWRLVNAMQKNGTCDGYIKCHPMQTCIKCKSYKKNRIEEYEKEQNEKQ